MKHTCPKCGKNYDIRDDFVKPGGMKLRCRQCKAVMVVKPPGEEKAPPPVPASPSSPPTTVTPAPREAVVSMPPASSPPAGDSELPVAARSGEVDLVDEFDLVGPQTPAKPPPSPAAKKIETEMLPGVSEKKADLPAARAGKLDEAFELDLPSPEPSARASEPEPPSATPGPAPGEGKTPLKTIAGMPTPLATPVPDEEPTAPPSEQEVIKKGATVMGMPAVKPPISELEDPFGELDLPAPARGGDKEGEFSLDEPMAASSPAPPARKPEKKQDEYSLDDDGDGHEAVPTPLPPVLSSPGSTPSVPVPAVASKQEDPDGGFGDLDLPAPKPPRQKAAQDSDFGGLDLPGPRPDEQEARAEGEDPFSDLELPVAQKQEKPAQTADPFADLDIPSELPGEDLAPPEEPQPPTPRDGKKDAKSDRDIFAEITDEVDDRPGVPGQGKEDESSMDDLLGGPLEDDQQEDQKVAQSTGEAGGVSFGEISLEDSDDSTSADELLEGGVDLPERKYGATPGAADGMSLDLDELGGGDVRTSAPPAPADDAKKKGKAEAPRKGISRLLVPLLVLVLLAGSGAALYFTGLYMDVYKFASKLAGRDIDAINAARERLLAEVSGELQEDTYAVYSDAADRVARHTRIHDDDLARGYFIYLAYTIQMRFGPDATWDRKAEAHLRRMRIGKELPREKALAVNSQKLFVGKDTRSALQSLGQIQRSRRKDTDVATLMALASLVAGDGKKALSSYESLGKMEGRSARVVFGMAQSYRLLGQNDRMNEALSELEKDHPDHLGAKILRAKALLRTGQLKQAEVLLNGVGKVGEGKLANSQASTVDALLGRIYLERQDTVRALEQFEKAAKADPENAEAIVGQATIHLLDQEPAKALGRFKVAASLDSSSIDARLGIVESQIDLANYTEAKKALEALRKAYPQEHKVHLLTGRLDRALKAYTDATDAYQKAIELNPAYLPSYLELASMYFETEQVAQAMDVLEEAKQKLPPTPNLHAAFGQGYIERGDLEGAMAELDEALEKDPEHVQAHFLEGVALYRMNEYEAAEEMFQWVEEHNPKHPGLILQQGLLFEAMGDLARAEDYYSKALEEQPDDPEVQIRTASILVYAQKYEQARKILDKVLEKDAGHPEAMYYLGRIELGEQKPMLALKLFEKSIRIKPNVAFYHLYAAIAQEENGSFTEALESADRALELDDDMAEAYLVRGRLLVRMSAVKDGTQDLLKALELKPDLIDAYAPLGKAAESMRNWKEAIQYYEKALQVDPERGDIHVDLALIQHERGSKASALEHFQQAVDLGRKQENKPKWYYTGLFYVGVHKEKSGDEQGAKKIYEEYLETAPLAAIDRQEVEKRLSYLESGY